MTALPNDIDTLKRMLVSRDETIAKLLAEIARLRRWQYGRSSERLGELMTQLQLALGDVPQTDLHAGSPSSTDIETHSTTAPTTVPAQSKVTPLRRPARSFPEHLPREVVTHTPSLCNCPHCGSGLRRLGEDVSEVLDYVPGYFRVWRHVRPKLACRSCAHIEQAPAPSRPITRGMADSGLLAQVLVSKYADHTPLYRQEQIYRRAGVQLERATLAAWVRESSRLLEPLANALGRYVKQAQKVHTDDTPVPVLEPGRGKTRTGRLWTYVRDDRPCGSRAPPAVWYQYSPDRKSERPLQHLQGFKGILQADAYAGYNALYQSGQIIEAACWAHARRKFFDLVELDRSPIAQEALARIAALYAIECEVRGKAAQVRTAHRQTHATPLLASMKDWLESTLMQVSAKSGLAKAIKYALGHWAALTRYCEDGRIEIDNNTAERSIRPLVIGRRNYLFAGSDGGGRSAAIIYSLISTARLNDVEPFAYLRTVLERIADHPINTIEKLLPWHLDLTNEAQSKAA
jgi:transposase